MIVQLTEAQYKTVLKEFYDPQKIYSYEKIAKAIKKGPKYMHHHINRLPKIECVDNQGVKHICTRIPEVVYNYLFGSF